MKQIYNALKKYLPIILGLFMIAIAFNLFFAPTNIAYGGTNGLGIVISKLYGINLQLTIVMLFFVFLIIGLIFLDFKQLLRTFFASILYSIFIVITANISDYIVLNYVNDLLLIYILGAIIQGIGSGLIYKRGYTTGGLDIIKTIIHENFYVSMGKLSIILNIAIVLAGAIITNNYTNIMYASIILYVIGFVTDKIILGSSEQKAFQIVSEKEEEIKNFVNKQLGHKVTIFNVRGGYSDKKESILFCVIPTNEYFLMKNAIKEIDKDAFFVVSDSYETKGYE